MAGIKVFAQLFSKSWRSPEASASGQGCGDEVPALYFSFLSNFF